MANLLTLHAAVLAGQIDAAERDLASRKAALTALADATTGPERDALLVDIAALALPPDVDLQRRILRGIRGNVATAMTNAQRQERANHSGPYNGQH